MDNYKIVGDILVRKATSNLKLQPRKQADLQIVKQPEVKTTKYSDINLKKWKDYAHIHGLKAQLYAMKGENEKAAEEYKLDGANYPLQILPYWGLLMAYGRMGREDLFPPVIEELQRRIKARNLTPEQINAIHQNPEYDLHPERIGKKEIRRPIWEPPF